MKKKKKQKKLHLMIFIFISTQVLFAPNILFGHRVDFLELLVWHLSAGSALIAAWWGWLRWARVKFPDIYDEQSTTALRER